MPIRAPYAHAAPTDGQIVCLDQRTPHVSVLHPGYPDPTNVILSLPAQDSALGGLHYATILTACGILCGNRWDGHLTKDRTGQPLIQAPMQIIAPGDYYLHFPLENGMFSPI